MRVTIGDIKEMKQKGERFSMLTAYDYSVAKLIDEAGVPLVLVGDSLGMVILGYESTIPVTMEDMLHHTKAVVRGTRRALVVADLPFMTYHTSVAEALRNSARCIQEGGAQAVKLEGGELMAETVRRVVQCGIPVMGHIGFTPQSVHQLGGYKVRGKSLEQAEQLVKDAVALEQAGAFAIVLETVPAALSTLITRKVSVPTIGIGSGLDCDAQVQVISDLLGLFTDFVPRHAKRYAHLAEAIRAALAQYQKEVKEGAFPAKEHSFTIDSSIIQELSQRET